MKVLVVGMLVAVLGFAAWAVSRWQGDDVAASTAECQTDWILDPLPTLAESSHLESVAVIAEDDVWAVGGLGGSLGSSTLIVHWDGLSWAAIDSPDPSNYFKVLKDVSGIASNDVWAVGWQIASQDADAQPLILHWDGSVWSEVPLPISATAVLRDVVAISRDDVWAVGGRAANSSLTVHWDGVQWTIIPSLNNPGISNDLEGIDALERVGPWVAGPPGLPGQNPTDDLIHRWNGIDWQDAGGVDGVTFPNLQDIETITADDVWAIGREGNGGGALVERWDGDAWSRREIPDSNSLIPMSIAAIDREAVWIATSHYDLGGAYGRVKYWNGHDWTTLGLDVPAFLWGIDADWRGSLWIVGGGIGSTGNQAFAAHHCASSARQFEWGNLACRDESTMADIIPLMRYVAGVPQGDARGCPRIGEEITEQAAMRQWGNVDCTGSIDGRDLIALLKGLAGIAAEDSSLCPGVGEVVNVS